MRRRPRTQAAPPFDPVEGEAHYRRLSRAFMAHDPGTPAEEACHAVQDEAERLTATGAPLVARIAALQRFIAGRCGAQLPDRLR